MDLTGIKEKCELINRMHDNNIRGNALVDAANKITNLVHLFHDMCLNDSLNPQEFSLMMLEQSDNLIKEARKLNEESMEIVAKLKEGR